MRKLLVYITIFSSLCFCQRLVYYCNFDTDLIGECLFNKTTDLSTLTIVSGAIPSSSKPAEPLSDITSIKLLTTPNNETCLLPYNYFNGSWKMHFCEWNTPTNFTCPTASGIGNCVIGKYAHFRTDLDDFNETYLINVKIQSNITYCLDFFYYFTDSLNETKIVFGWKSNNMTRIIVEETAVSEYKWQQSRTTFVSPLVNINQIWFRMTHNHRSSGRFIYAFDEIMISEGSCDTVSSFSLAAQSDIVDSEISTESTLTVSFETTDEEMNFTTSDTNTTSETDFTTITSNLTTTSSNIDDESRNALIISLGTGIPALLIIVGGIFYHYRKGQQQTLKALTNKTNSNEIELTETDA